MMILQSYHETMRGMWWKGGMGRGREGRAGKAPQCHTLHAQDEMKSTIEFMGGLEKQRNGGSVLILPFALRQNPSSTILHFLLKSSGSKDDINE